MREIFYHIKAPRVRSGLALHQNMVGEFVRGPLLLRLDRDHMGHSDSICTHSLDVESGLLRRSDPWLMHAFGPVSRTSGRPRIPPTHLQNTF